MVDGGLTPRRAFYRAHQFFQALGAGLKPLRPAEAEEAQTYLPESAWPLFLAMAREDQRHSLNVLRTLQRRGPVNVPLAQAALLHDCAKARSGMQLWHRVAVVLLRAFWPGLLARWCTGPMPPRHHWRYPFWTHLNHPARGAEMAEAVGCDRQTVWLIAHHQDPMPAPMGDPQTVHWLAALQAADDDN